MRRAVVNWGTCDPSNDTSFLGVLLVFTSVDPRVGWQELFSSAREPSTSLTSFQKGRAVLVGQGWCRPSGFCGTGRAGLYLGVDGGPMTSMNYWLEATNIGLDEDVRQNRLCTNHRGYYAFMLEAFLPDCVSKSKPGTLWKKLWFAFERLIGLMIPLACLILIGFNNNERIH